MKQATKPRGDSSLFVPGVGRREFVRQVGTFAAAAAALNPMRARAQRADSSSSKKKGPIMLAELNHALFASRVGATFEATINPAFTVTLELVEATLLPVQPNRPAALGARAPFSLVFRAPRGTDIPQRTYELRHPEIGAFGIFLVPIGPDETGPRYEAVFN
jgi:hypothetical protein